MDDYGDFDDYGWEPYNGDDLEALGQQESWEHAQAEREDMYDSDEDFEDDIDGEFLLDGDWGEPAEDSYLDTAYEDRTDLDYLGG